MASTENEKIDSSPEDEETPAKGLDRRVRNALFVLLFVGLVAGAILANIKGGSELKVYITGAARMMKGENIYRKTDVHTFAYPPFFALAFVPLAALPDAAHRTVWFLINAGLLAWIFVLLNRMLQPVFRANEPRGPPRWLFWIVVMAVAVRHLSSVLQNQSHDFIILLVSLLTVVSLANGEDKKAGAMAGIGAACKATPALFLVLFVWQRRFHAVLLFAMISVVLTFLPDLLLPQKEGGSWLVSWTNTMVKDVRIGEPADSSGVWGAWNVLNQNLAGTLYRLFTLVETDGKVFIDVSLWHMGRTELKVLTMASQLAIVAIILLACRPRYSADLAEDEKTFRRLGEGGMILCGMVLLSPMSSKAHFCVLLVPIAFCVAQVFYRKGDRIQTALLVAMFVTGTLSTKGILRELGQTVLAYGTVTACALCAFAATAWILMKGSSAPRTENDSPGDHHG
jgi:hypothetical protein